MKSDGLKSTSNSWGIILLGSLLLGSLWLFAWLQLSYERTKTIEQESLAAMNLAKAFEENVRSIIGRVDADILTIKQAYEKEGPGSPVIAAILEQSKQESSRVQAGVANEQGRFILSSEERALTADFADRAWFWQARESTADVLYINRTVAGRFSVKGVIPLSRRINKPDGSFGGAVHVGLNTNYFEEIFKRLQLGPGGVMTLTGLDGYIRIRQSSTSSDFGQNIRQGGLWKSVQQWPARSDIIRSAVDGVDRLQTYRVLPEYPLFIVVGTSVDTVLAGFEQRKRYYVYSAATGSLVIVALCFMAIKRKRAEDDLAESEARYRAVIEQSPEAILLCNPVNGEILEANSQFAEISGYDIHTDGPLNIFELLADTRDGIQSYQEELKRTGFLPMQRRQGKHRNGTVLSIERAARVVRYNEKVLVVATIRDVSQDVRREQEILRDAQLAERVQKALLKDPAPSDDLEIATIYQPYGYVGGDLYFLDWRYGGGMLRGFIVDAAGHGLGTALHTATLHVLIREVNELDLPLSEAMRWLNLRAAEYFDEDTFAGALGFELDLETRQLRWVCAGVSELWMANKTTRGAVVKPGMFLGLHPDEMFETHTMPIDVGDSFYFMTDGLTEQLQQQAQLPLHRFSEMVARLQKLSSAEGRRDDATAVCIHVRSLPQSSVRRDGWPRILRFNGYGDYQRLKGEIANILAEVTGLPHSLHEVAVNEALANAMECRDGVPRQHKARLRFNKVGNRLIVRVKTSRMGFAGNAVLRRLRSHPEDMFSFGEDASMGRGIPMMLSMSHKMTYNSEGTEVLLAWKL